MKPQRRGPRPVAPAIARLRARLAPPTTLAAVQQVWDEVVGARIVAEARPAAQRGETIVVECASSVWAAELEMIAPDLLERLNESLAERSRIEALRFVVRPV